MKRSEFLDTITTWDELLDFCREYDLETCSEIYDSDGVDEEIENDVCERECGWYELMGALQEIPDLSTGAFFVRNGWLDYSCVDDRFGIWKRAVLEDCDVGIEFWDPELEEDEDEVFDPFALSCDGYLEKEDNGVSWMEEESPDDVAALLSICESSVRIISSK